MEAPVFLQFRPYFFDLNLEDFPQEIDSAILLEDFHFLHLVFGAERNSVPKGMVEDLEVASALEEEVFQQCFSERVPEFPHESLGFPVEIELSQEETSHLC